MNYTDEDVRTALEAADGLTVSPDAPLYGGERTIAVLASELRRQNLLLTSKDQVIATLERRLKHLKQTKAPPIPLKRPVTRALMQTVVGKDLRVSALIMPFCESRKQDRRLTEYTETFYRGTLSELGKILGDPKVTDISRTELRYWRDCLIAKGLATSTIRSRFAAVRTFFNWIRLERIADIEMPASYICPRPEYSNRDAYTAEELHALFHSPLYTGCKRPGVYSKPGSYLETDRHFWFPLIGLLCGLRINEIAHLKRSHIQKIDGVWCLSITITKTLNGKRTIPLNPTLIEIGLLDYMEDLKSDTLWPDIKTKHFNKSSPMVAWYGRFRHSIGLVRPGLTFHSFRKNFASALLRANVQEPVAAQLLGHQYRRPTYGLYGRTALSARDKLEIMQGLDFGVDFTHLQGFYEQAKECKAAAQS